MRNPDGRPLVLYLRTEEDHSLTGNTRQLLERINAADKAAKVRVRVQQEQCFTASWALCSHGSMLTQVVDHSGSAEEGASLIYAQLEKIIKQV